MAGTTTTLTATVTKTIAAAIARTIRSTVGRVTIRRTPRMTTASGIARASIQCSPTVEDRMRGKSGAPMLATLSRSENWPGDATSIACATRAALPSSSIAKPVTRASQ